MDQRPYVGIAAVATGRQIEDCLRSAQLLSESQVLALGFQVSSKTLRGEVERYPEVYPKYADLRDLCICYRLAIKAKRGEFHLHFSPESGDDLDQQLKQIAMDIGSLIDGLQINQSEPSRAALARWRERFPEQRLILPITPATLRRFDKASDLSKWLKEEYGSIMTDVLFDLSGGRGQTLDSSLALHYLEQLRQDWPGLGLGVAGGLGPFSLKPVWELWSKLKPLSWDAQSQLCLPGRGLDKLRTQLYVQLSGAIPLLE